MLVSQYIYTACGKDRNGAFSLFSKSKDISDAEHSEIREMMMYRAPAGLPIEPTQEEIEEQFPKKFAYFNLTSGRVCIAQTCYVGKVYSDHDPRTGNYIIHAFVFEKNDDLAPYSLVEHEAFKRFLTYKEWHDDPIPESLPQIDIPTSGVALTSTQISTFFTPERQEKLKLLIEAVLSSSPENIVHLHIEHQNQAIWLKALNHCIPKAILNKVSFCSLFINSLIEGNISSQIQLRINRPEGNQFNYTQDIQRGKYALDLVKNIYPTYIKPSRYTEEIVNNLINTKDFFNDVVLFVDKLQGIITTYSVNANQAADLLNLSLANYSYFPEPSEIFQTIILAEKVGYETVKIAENTWKNLPQLGLSNQQQLDCMGFVYKTTTDLGLKMQIIDYILENDTLLEVDTKDVATFSDGLSTKAGYILEQFLHYVKAKGVVNYVKQYQSTPYKTHFLFALLTEQESVKTAAKAMDFTTNEEAKAVRDIMLSAYKAQSIEDINSLITLANNSCPNMGNELLATLAKSTQHITDMPFAFEVLNHLDVKNPVASEFLWQLIEQHSDKEELLNQYNNAQKQRPDFFANFENENKDKGLMISFSRKKEAFRFANQQLDITAIRNFFKKYYITGDDPGLLVKKLPEYLGALPSERKLTECDALLKEIALQQDVPKSLLTPIYEIVFNTIFTSTVLFRQIQDKCRIPEYLQRINSTYKVLKDANIEIDTEKEERYNILLCGNILEKCSNNESTIRSFFEGQSEEVRKIEPILKAINTANIEIFVDNYFPIVVKMLFIGFTKNTQYEDTMKGVFGKVLMGADQDKITDRFITLLEKYKDKNIDFILFLLSKHIKKDQTALDKQLGSIASVYLVKLEYKERQDIFKELDIACKPEEKQLCQQFVNKFNEDYPKKKFLGIF